MNTIYECHQKTTNYCHTYAIVCCQPTERAAIEWLENNGGGIYKNVLHKFQFEVKAI